VENWFGPLEITNIWGGNGKEHSRHAQTLQRLVREEGCKMAKGQKKLQLHFSFPPIQSA
jgi:hypothetical protein